MIKFCLGLTLFSIFAFGNTLFAQSQSDAALSKVTLYSWIQYRNPKLNDCFSFQNEKASNCESGRREKWDFRYGGLRAGDDWDWFDVSPGANRSKIVYLGQFDWADTFKVPVIEPFPILKEGERFNIVVDTSGADGEPGKDGKHGANGRNADGTLNQTQEENNASPATSEKPIPKKRQISDVFVKAKPGGMYAIRVAEENSDFYAVFRVESLKRGGECVISWKKIASPKE